MAIDIAFRKGEEEVFSHLLFGTNVSRAKTFVNAIAKYTTADISHVWTIVRSDVSIPEKSGDIQSLDLYAHLFFRRAKDNKLYSFKIHAPSYSELFNDDQEVPTDIGNAIAGYYSALAGEIFSFHFGALAGEMA